MSACDMPDLRDRYVWDALERAREGDTEGAQRLLDRAAQVWPVEEEQFRAVQTALREAAAGWGTETAELRDPNRLRSTGAARSG